MSLTKVTYSMIKGASANILDFGADPTGVDDSTNAIQAAIDYVMAQGYGGEIWFPRGKYRVTSTIEVIGDYTAAGMPRGIRFVGDMGTVNPSPTTADSVNDSVIFGDGIDTDKPVFYCWGGHNNTFEHLCIFGAPGSDAATQAYACVWVDYNHENYRFYDCKFGLAPIGIRVCSSYNYSTGAWTPAVSAYDGTTFVPNIALGGFASDNGKYDNCTFSNSLACISVESAQALDMASSKCVFRPDTTAKGIYITGCQGFSFYDCTTLGNTFIYLDQKASIGNIVSYNHHIENGSDPSYVFVLDSNTTIGQGCSLNTGGGGIVSLKGALTTPQSTFKITNCILSGVEFNHEGMSAIIENSRIVELNKTASANGEFLKLVNVTVDTLTGNWNYFKKQIFESVTLPGFTALAKIPFQSGTEKTTYAADLIMGPPATTAATAETLAGTTYYNPSGAQVVGAGCHFTPAGTLVVDWSYGAKVDFVSSGVTVATWTGETVGATPTLTTLLSNTKDFGTYIVQRTSDGNVPVGSMYYNTSTGKFRRRDASGWADF